MTMGGRRNHEVRFIEYGNCWRRRVITFRLIIIIIKIKKKNAANDVPGIYDIYF